MTDRARQRFPERRPIQDRAPIDIVRDRITDFISAATDRLPLDECERVLQDVRDDLELKLIAISDGEVE